MELTSGPAAPTFGQHEAPPPAYEESSHPVGPSGQPSGQPSPAHRPPELPPPGYGQAGGYINPAYGQPGGPDITLSMVEAMRQHRQEG